MRNSLYEEFNCRNKEELYEKIKNQDEDIKPLIEFLDYARANIKNNRQAITSPDTLTDEKTNKEDNLCNKIDDFINSYVELSNAMYGVDYDFVENYPLDKSFHDIDFIDWAEATKTNLSKTKNKMKPGKGSKETKKESTIEKLNKLKDKVAKDSIGKVQEKVENKENDREM